MLENLAGVGGLASVVAAFGWWVWRDGLVRLIAGVVAVAHRDQNRRADAREVLRLTSTRCSPTRRRST